MRESMGAAWIFSICLTFIILFTAYLAISVNYAKAFRIKSHIVTMIEENEGYPEGNSAALAQDIETYLTSQGYTARGTCAATLPNSGGAEWRLADCLHSDASGNCGVCIYRTGVDSGAGNDNINVAKAYYRVVAFFKFDLPVVSYFTTFRVSGESKYVLDYANNLDY